MHIRRGHRWKSKGALVVLVAVLAVPAVAWAYFSATTTQTNTFGAGTLYAPGAVTTQHVEAVNNDGSVTLTWTETSGSGTLTPPSYQVLRATAGSSPSFSTIATLTAGSSNNSTTANCSGSTCTWTDNSTNDSSSPPGFNTQYEYEIQSYAGGFTAGPDSAYDALSMTPTSALDSTRDNLLSVAAVSGTIAWAVGASCAMEVTTNGTTWTQVTLSTSVCPSGTNLTSIYVIDATDGWAVGSGGLILVCTASCTGSSATWVKLTTEPVSVNLNSVTAIKNGPNYDVWAVGASDTVVYCAAATCSTAASTFTSINPTNLSGDTLNAVYTFDGKEAWLAGTTSSSGGVIASCTSTANCESAASTGWVVATSPSAPMNAVYAQGNGLVYAVGNSGAVYACISNCQNASPTFATVSGTGVGSTNLTDAYVQANGAAWLVGAGGFVDDCSATCNATSGGTWKVAAAGTTQNLNAVAGTGAADVWAVGANGSIVSNISNVIGFNAESSAISGSGLNSVAAVSGTIAWAVGASCAMEVTTNGTTWTQVTLSTSVCPSGTNLTSIYVIDATDGWAVGSGGLILVCTASCTGSSATWVKLTTEPVSVNLNSVTAIKNGPNYDVWAVGASDTVVYCAAATCSTAASTFTSINPTNLSGDTLNAVYTFDGKEAWLAGTTSSSGGVIASCTSTANCESAASTGWVVATSPSAPMNAVYAQGNGLVYAVGNSGAVYACISNCQNASPTFATVSGTGVGSTNLTDAYVQANGAAWLVGAGGFVDDCSATCNATSGGTWKVAAAGTTQNLNAVAGTGAADVWAVGANGSIVSNISNVIGFNAESSGLSAYTLQSGDLAGLQTINTTPSPYVTGPLPSGLPSSSSCSSSDLEVGFTPSVSGDPIGAANVIIDYELSSATSTSSALLVSTNNGSTWTSAGSLGTPTASYQSVNVNVTSDIGVVTTSAAQLQLCIELSGSGNPTASIQQVHLDVDASFASAPSFTSAGSTTFTVGSSGSFTIAASGPPSPTFTESGTLPTGVSFAGGTGTATLSGTPGSGTGGTYPLTFTATNGITATNQSFTLSVDQAPAITSASSTTFTVGSAGSFTMTETGYPTPTFSDTSFSGCTASTLPSGVTLSSSGLLSGTPAAGTLGTYTVCVQASNGVGSAATQTFTLTVSFAGLAFTDTTLSGGSLSCSNQNTPTVTCTAMPLGGTGSFKGEVELVNASGTAVTNTSGSAMTVSASETTVSSPGGSVSPSSLTIANASSTTSSQFTLTGLGSGWKGTMTCTVTYGGTTYTIAVTGN